MTVDTTPRCADCGTIYCLYREEAHAWVCADCWAGRNDPDPPRFPTRPRKKEQR